MSSIDKMGFCRLRSKNGQLHYYHSLPTIAFCHLNGPKNQNETAENINFEYEKDLFNDRKLIIETTTQLGQDIVITDAGLCTTIIYAESLSQVGKITRNDCEQLWKIIDTSPNNIPCCVIYLESSPEKCLERIQERKIPYESYIDLTFLQQIDREFYRFLFCWLTKKALFINIPESADRNNAILYETVLIRIIELWNLHNPESHSVNLSSTFNK
jgi:deoxyadenosine/deoxycytidine kinase